VGAYAKRTDIILENNKAWQQKHGNNVKGLTKTTTKARTSKRKEKQKTKHGRKNQSQKLRNMNGE